MKTKRELIDIVNLWWEYNQTLAQVGEARYFDEQIRDWESHFQNYQTEGWVQPPVDFDLVRCKDVKGGISIRIESYPNIIDGILDIKTGTLSLKDLSEVNTTGSLALRGASMRD